MVLIGPPGSGKSTFARELIRAGKITADSVISSDSIGEELFGPGFSSERDPQIFAERDRRLRRLLGGGNVAFADSTNVTPAARERLLRLAAEANVSASALRFPVPAERLASKIVIARNRSRRSRGTTH